MDPIPYHKFRTGYTFADVYHMIYNRKHKRRRGVLGYWRELKLAMYDEYVEKLKAGCLSEASYVPDNDPIPD
jgi:hypothetical protein